MPGGGTVEEYRKRRIHQKGVDPMAGNQRGKKGRNQDKSKGRQQSTRGKETPRGRRGQEPLQTRQRGQESHGEKPTGVDEGMNPERR
jgi:hypothetical protein